MHREAISKPTERVFGEIAGRFTDGFYLAGGTALAIQLGHRLSVDLDWFSAKEFSRTAVRDALSRAGRFELTGEEEGTMHGLLDGVKVSFLRYGYPLLFPPVEFEGAKLADERDIAAMKLDAVSSRGSKKDFIDIYFLLEKYALPELLEIFEKKYAAIKFNKLHILKSLSYFEDADREPTPVMLRPVSWEAVKEKIAAEASKVLR
jgi:predicted nucleotidyltransferase component of viral defense system